MFIAAQSRDTVSWACCVLLSDPAKPYNGVGHKMRPKTIAVVCTLALSAETVHEPVIRDRNQPHIHQEDRSPIEGITSGPALGEGATGPAASTRTAEVPN